MEFNAVFLVREKASYLIKFGTKRYNSYKHIHTPRYHPGSIREEPVKQGFLKSGLIHQGIYKATVWVYKRRVIRRVHPQGVP